jgi:signal transduction histidine kinase
MLASHPVDADTGSATSDSPSRKLSGRPNALSRALAAGLAHHVNNPLLGIIGSLELALREVEPDSPESDHIERSLKCALQAAEAVRRLVAFAYHPVSALRLRFRCSQSQPASRGGCTTRDRVIAS